MVYKNQVLVALAVSIGPFAVGLTRGYFASTMVSMQNPKVCGGLGFSDQQISWISSFGYMGAFLGGILGGMGMNLGRRTVLMATAVPFALTWYATAVSNYYPLILTATFGGSVFMSCIMMTARVYITEISACEIRGSLTSLVEILSQIGILISFWLGSYISWGKLALIAVSSPAWLLIAQLFIPESPSSLLLRNKEEEARSSLQWIRGHDTDIQTELDMMKRNIETSKIHTLYDVILKWTSWSQILQRMRMLNFMLKRLKRPLFITCGVAFFRRFTGTDFFFFYGVNTFRKTFWVMDPYNGATLVFLVQLISSCMSALLVDSVGRKPLLFVSGGIMFVALTSFGTLSHYRIELVTFRFYDWTCLLCVFTYTIASALGVYPISSVLTGDLIPLEHRKAGGILTSSFSYLCAFVNIKIAIDIEGHFGISGLFWIYAAMSVLYIFFVALYVFETKGTEIDEKNQKYVEALLNSIQNNPNSINQTSNTAKIDLGNVNLTQC